MLTEKFWEKYFKEYDSLNLLYPYQNLLEEIMSHINHGQNEPDIKLLDLGAGTGNLIKKINEKYPKIKTVGLDYSQQGLKIIKEKSPQSKLILHDLNNELSFSDNEFDFVTSNNTLYTISPEKRINVIKEIFRILKPGGILILSNIKEGFSPVTIYKEHIKEEIKKNGYLKTIFKIIQLLKPTIKIFYYNSLIKKENSEGNYGFVKEEEQKDLMKEAGFINITENKLLYGSQAILNRAEKQR